MLKTRIPIREPHVRQFVVARYGNNTNVIDLTKKSMLGALTELACEKVGFRHVLPKADVDEKIAITLLYPDSLKNHFIHPGKLDLVAKMLAYLFTQAFLEAIEVSVMLGISDYEAVNLFMDRYGITEDMVSADTLRKKWRDHQRHMARKMTVLLQSA
ncbi:hypothetical protein GO730_00630 [Spirosoma sp. HMF3257]|uniref:Uncharacterized protein n=1 Tax=Spirosoma telluris TaxID=2183553 RepID=A0A327NEH2_9BACT|nr:hypothetical protein [Spirosoma telluris]RAI73305.1 hypothetical protein HMF3257_00615 [Spirosoma telluris]